MFAPHTITAAAADPAFGSVLEGGAEDSDWARAAIDARALRRVAALDRWAEHGMDLVEAMKRDALAGPPPAAPEPAAPQPAAPDSATAADVAEASRETAAIAARWASHAQTYARLARAARQCYALAAKFDVDSDTRRAQALKAATAEAAAAAARAADPFTGRWTDSRDPGQDRRDDVAGIITPLIEKAVDALDDPVRAERLYVSLYERLDDPDDTEGLMDRPLGQVVAQICRDLGIEPDWEGWSTEDWAIDEGEAREPGSPFMTVRVTTDRSYMGPEPRAILRPSWVAAQTATVPP